MPPGESTSQKQGISEALSRFLGSMRSYADRDLPDSYNRIVQNPSAPIGEFEDDLPPGSEKVEGWSDPLLKRHAYRNDDEGAVVIYREGFVVTYVPPTPEDYARLIRVLDQHYGVDTPSQPPRKNRPAASDTEAENG